MRSVIIIARSKGVYNRIYTKELWNKVNPDNKAILEDFISEYRQRKKSKGTIDGYFQDLRIIFIYILQHRDNKCILELNKKDFRNISLYLSDETDRGSSRTNRMKSAINSLLTYCEEEEEYDYEVNYAKKVKGLPKEKRKTNEDNFYFTFDEFIKVRNKLVKQNDLQTAVMWSLCFDSGARKNELYQVQKHNLLNSNRTNVVKGKRGKMFPLIYLNDTRDLIKKYLEQRGEDNIDSLWFQKIKGEKFPIKYETMYGRILKCSDILGEIRGKETEIFPHSIRHARCNILTYEKQGDPRILDKDGKPKIFTFDEVAILLNHSSSETTKGYAKDKSMDILNSMFNFDEQSKQETDNQTT